MAADHLPQDHAEGLQVVALERIRSSADSSPVRLAMPKSITTRAVALDEDVIRRQIAMDDTQPVQRRDPAARRLACSSTTVRSRPSGERAISSRLRPRAIRSQAWNTWRSVLAATSAARPAGRPARAGSRSRGRSCASRRRLRGSSLTNRHGPSRPAAPEKRVRSGGAAPAPAVRRPCGASRRSSWVNELSRTAFRQPVATASCRRV